MLKIPITTDLKNDFQFGFKIEFKKIGFEAKRKSEVCPVSNVLKTELLYGVARNVD